MSWLVLIITGAIIGWLASLITVSPRGILAYIIIGIIGAFLGRLIFYDWLKIGSAYESGAFSLVGILWGVLGAIVLIVVLRILGF